MFSDDYMRGIYVTCEGLCIRQQSFLYINWGLTFHLKFVFFSPVED